MNGDSILMGQPQLSLITIKEEPKDLSFKDFKSRSDHPYSPWGPLTKFYIRFTVNPIHEFNFHYTHSDLHREYHKFPAVHVGVVLTRPYEGNGNLCIWKGQLVDALLNVGGIDARIANNISETLHYQLMRFSKWKEMVGIEVEMNVVTPFNVGPNEALEGISEAIVSISGDCGSCSVPLARDMVVRRASCSHIFHVNCLSLLIGSSSRACPVCRVEFDSI